MGGGARETEGQRRRRERRVKGKGFDSPFGKGNRKKQSLNERSRYTPPADRRLNPPRNLPSFLFMSALCHTAMHTAGGGSLCVVVVVVLVYHVVYLELLGPPSALREPTAMHTSPQKQPKQTPLHDTDCHHQTAMPIDDPDPLLGPAEAPLGPRPRAWRHGWTQGWLGGPILRRRRILP